MRALIASVLGLAAVLHAGDVPRRLVDIDFVATDRHGRPVVDLRADEIRILASDGELAVSTLRFISPSAGRAADPPSSNLSDPAAGLVVALFLDEYHVRPEAAERVRDGLRRFIEAHVNDHDRLLVLKPLQSLVTLGVASSREEVLHQIAAFNGRKQDYAPRNAFERTFIAADPERIDEVRAQLALSALSALVTQAGRAGRGRKALVIVSEGFRPPASRRGAERMPTLESLVEAASRARVVAYPIAPGAFVASRDARLGPVPSVGGEQTRDREVLHRLARETDGWMAERSEDMAHFAAHLARALTGYYLAAVEVSADGRFHPAEIVARRDELRIVGPRGYWAPIADEVLSSRGPGAVATKPSEHMVPAPRVSRLVRPWFGVARGSPGRTEVAFTWEPTPQAAGERTRIPPAARVGLIAQTAEGQEVFRGSVRPAGAPIGSEPALVRFEAPPGRLRVVMTIEDAAARVLDTDVRDVTVSPLSGALVIGTPAIIRTQNARDRRAAAGDLSVAPAVSHEFTRREQLLIRFPVYAETTATVTATLLGRSGQVLRVLPVMRRGEAELYETDLPLAPFATGEYAVRLTASSAATTVHQTVPVRVVP